MLSVGINIIFFFFLSVEKRGTNNSVVVWLSLPETLALMERNTLASGKRQNLKTQPWVRLCKHVPELAQRVPTGFKWTFNTQW